MYFRRRFAELIRDGKSLSFVRSIPGLGSWIEHASFRTSSNSTRGGRRPRPRTETAITADSSPSAQNYRREESTDTTAEEPGYVNDGDVLPSRSNIALNPVIEEVGSNGHNGLSSSVLATNDATDTDENDVGLVQPDHDSEDGFDEEKLDYMPTERH